MSNIEPIKSKPHKKSFWATVLNILSFAGVMFVPEDAKFDEEGDFEQKKYSFVADFCGFLLSLATAFVIVATNWCMISKHGFFSGLVEAFIPVFGALLCLFFLPLAIRLLTLPFCLIKKTTTPRVIAICVTTVIVFYAIIAFYTSQIIYSVNPSYNFSESIGISVPDIFEQTQQKQPSQEKQPSQDHPQYTYYIGNKKTKKYHKPSCSYLPSSENQVKIPVKDINKSKYSQYSPCGHCNP